MEQHQIGIELIVKGRISTVRWLESAPYNASKQKSGQYWCYVVSMSDEDAAYQLKLKLEGDEDAARFRDDTLHVDTGVWVDVVPIFDVAAIAATEAAQRCAEEAQPIPAGFAGTAQLLRQKGERVTPETCRDFVVAQIEKLERAMYFKRAADLPTLRRLLGAISVARPEQAATMYEEYRAQLQVWAQQYK